MNKSLSLITVTLLFSIFFISCNKEEKHFITDKEYRETVHQDFLKREKMAEGRKTPLFSVFQSSISLEEKEALEFLYAYMPLSDLADYDGTFFLRQVQYAFKARDYFSWGKSIPEDVFRHFVLVYRVNNENLDTARMLFFEELKERVKGLSMYDAALEVNHWCHEKVTYRASDIRTSAPLATMKSGYGRCGEESTFTVTAMRAAGIPARQCYTPRWAHTDDNHAWVEVWVDGKWYFLGACEPDAELNMGWFAAPATRTMMVHSNAFGKYTGKEEINLQTDLYSKINMLPNYTDTKKITVKVTDQNGNPVQDAEVDFRLYNYAEYYPLASRKTDQNGIATLTTGLGDLLIWASKSGLYNYAKMDVRKNAEITLSLTKSPGTEYVELFDMMPPKGKTQKSSLPQEKIDRNNRRLLYEDSVRNAYLATFMTQDEAKSLKNDNLTEDQIWEIISKSEGNYAEIVAFINSHSAKKENFYLYDYIKSVSDKDLRDITADLLEQHITFFNKENYSYDVYKKGIISPRISNEGIRPWRTFLKSQFTRLFGEKSSVKQLSEWTVSNITLDENANYFNCPVSPQGVFELRYANSRSRDIFFVAACRSMNIPAYLDNATGQIFSYENGQWNIFSFENKKEIAQTGTLILTYNGSPELKPEYWIHYTIAVEKGGKFETFDFEDDPRVAQFPVKLELEAGYYMLSTGNRYSDGAVLSRVEFFNILPGKTATRNLEIRKLEPRKVLYGNVDLNYKITLPDAGSLTVKELTEKNSMVLCFIDPTREPTKHLFKDIASFKTQFEKWNGNMIFVIPSDKKSTGFDPVKWKLPHQAKFIEDINSKWMNAVLKSSGQDFAENYPLIFIVNNKGQITFKSEGYKIGTGELIYKSLLENSGN